MSDAHTQLACASRTLSWSIHLMLVAMPDFGLVDPTSPVHKGQHGRLVGCSQAVRLPRAQWQVRGLCVKRIIVTCWPAYHLILNSGFSCHIFKIKTCHNLHVAPQYATDRSLKHHWLCQVMWPGGRIICAKGFSCWRAFTCSAPCPKLAVFWVSQ